ncbi:MAG: hypothetical protein IKC63_04225, partial [Clostridia bacterium]|nr:hypothetical protein [Clostridia bacterium]
MSEAEKKRRLDYKKNRKKWLLIQIIIIAVVSAVVLSMAITYRQVSRTFYVDYTEQSDIDYRVQLAPNEFYEEEWLAKDKAYVAALIQNIMATFRYDVKTDSKKGMSYSYAYGVDATLRISDKYTGAVIYEPVTELIPMQTHTQSGGQNLSITQPVLVDYSKYNDTAVMFLQTYGLKDVNCALELTLRVNVTGSCDDFKTDSENVYFTTLRFPLAVDKTEPTVTSSLSNGESKSMACTTGANKNVFLVLGIVFGSLDLIGAAFFFIFMYATRNHDINYAIKVKRLVASYRSFIQEISTPFNTEGYQIVYIKTFNEMLEVRDTIGAPLLMYANADGTATSFVVPSTMGILYSFEIRVEDYDDIYGLAEGDRSTEKKNCFKVVWEKICDFFRNLKKKPAPAAPAEETPIEEAPAEE